MKKYLRSQGKFVSIGRKADVIGAVNADSAMWGVRRRLVRNTNLQTVQLLTVATAPSVFTLQEANVTSSTTLQKGTLVGSSRAPTITSGRSRTAGTITGSARAPGTIKEGPGPQGKAGTKGPG